MPDLVPNREMVTTHHFDIDVEPAQIVWGKRAIEVDERKDNLRTAAKEKFTHIVNIEVLKETDQYPETQYDPSVVDAARAVFEARMDAINAAVTHEDIDDLTEV